MEGRARSGRILFGPAFGILDVAQSWAVGISSDIDDRKRKRDMNVLVFDQCTRGISLSFSRICPGEHLYGLILCGWDV